MSGVGWGLKGFFKSVGSGVAGIAKQPYKGAKENGVRGFFDGAGKGIAGLVTKPISGTFGLISETSKGVKNTPAYMKSTPDVKPRRIWEPRIFYQRN